METEQDTYAPTIASPAAYGFGPSVAMPTLLGMMPDMPNFDESIDGEGEGGDVMKYLEESKQQLTPQVRIIILD